MSLEEYVLVQDFCSHHHLKVTFIHELEEYGLIELVRQEEREYFPTDIVERIEKLVRLHQDLEIHPADLDVVFDLTERIGRLEKEIEQAHRVISQFERRFLLGGEEEED